LLIKRRGVGGDRLGPPSLPFFPACGQTTLEL
jgi:hypothetical protein